jgi:YbbR domain-containing protein
VRRLIGRIVHNWPLKLAAVGLATLMYGGLALSQNTQTYQGVIPVRYVNEPPDTVVSPSTPPPVTSVRYFASSGVTVATSTFVATIDLAGFDDKVGVVSVRIVVSTPDPRIRVLGYTPDFATIELDELKSLNDVPVKVVHGPVPDGLTLGTTEVEPATVTVSGAASILARVDAVRADVVIPATSIDVNEDVQLIPIDKLGNALSPLDVSPPTAQVIIPVFADRQSRTLPVNAIITGTPAAGFEIESVTVAPQVVLVAGDADRLAQLTQVDTDPIPMTGVSADETVEVGLALPTGVVAVDVEPILVTITIRPVTATRTFNVGVHLVGARGDLTYSLGTDQVLATIGGSTADLDRLVGATLLADLDVTGLGAGAFDLPVTVDVPAGTTLVAVSPQTVKVTITIAAAASGSPPVPAPSGSPPAPSPSGG